MLLDELKPLVDSASIVSFDVFDTCILRKVDHPHSVFELMEEKTGIRGFAKVRIEAEKIARERIVSKHRQEITLVEIYESFSSIFDLKNLEIEIEYSVCEVNNEIFEIFNYCLAKNKKLIFTSDMYLDIVTIRNILFKCGYNVDKSQFFLSSNILRSKYYGDLYKYIINNFKINPVEIFHIGDNYFSDYTNAVKYGLKAYHYKKGVNL